ncbi:MAG: hypothetical protein HQ592_18945 [Planctomycetes bacterium]|nr:hypothetical protein [Planctomycetota bacterium]
MTRRAYPERFIRIVRSNKMIWESGYWKDDLLRLARVLTHKQQQKVWRESSMARVEKSIMTGFYIIRKLMDARKLSDAVVLERVSIQSFPHRGKPVTLMNWDHIDRHYDLDRSHQTSRSLIWLANQMVHSYVFIVSVDETGGLNGVFFSSDKERNKALHFAEATKVIQKFEQIGGKCPWKERYILNPDTGDYDVTLE